MNCKKFPEWIPLHVSEDLEIPKQEKLQKHLFSCSSCKKLMRKYEEDQKQISMLKERKLSPVVWENYWETIRFRLEESPKESENITVLKWGTRIAMAASILMAIFLWGGKIFPKTSPSSYENTHSVISRNIPQKQIPRNRAIIPVNNGKNFQTSPSEFLLSDIPQIFLKRKKQKSIFLSPTLPRAGSIHFEIQKGKVKIQFFFSSKKKLEKTPTKNKERTKKNEQTMEF